MKVVHSENKPLTRYLAQCTASFCIINKAHSTIQHPARIDIFWLTLTRTLCRNPLWVRACHLRGEKKAQQLIRCHYNKYLGKHVKKRAIHIKNVSNEATSDVWEHATARWILRNVKRCRCRHKKNLPRKDWLLSTYIPPWAPTSMLKQWNTA